MALLFILRLDERRFYRGFPFGVVWALVSVFENAAAFERFQVPFCGFIVDSLALWTYPHDLMVP